MTDNGQNQAPDLGRQFADFTANPRVRRAAVLGVKVYLVWFAFVALLVLAGFVLVGYLFLHSGA